MCASPSLRTTSTPCAASSTTGTQPTASTLPSVATTGRACRPSTRTTHHRLHRFLQHPPAQHSLAQQPQTRPTGPTSHATTSKPSIDTKRRTRHRVQTRGLASHDRVSGNHRQHHPSSLFFKSGPARLRGIEGCWHRLGSLCHEDAAGFEVGGVGEAVGAAPEHLEQVDAPMFVNSGSRRGVVGSVLRGWSCG